ncbi:hypothetical protein BH11PSE12_BH11PSE12_23250 [soil metagenome]
MPLSPTPLPRYWFLHVLGLASAYALAGWLSRLLAIPPGYSMAVYPPAGLALGVVLAGGYHLLPGVALGSLLVNLIISFDNAGQLTGTDWKLSAMLAGGACLQVAASTYLIRKRLGDNLALDTDRAIFNLFIYGGVIGCLVSSSVGISSLYLLGILPATELNNNWVTWWMGDTLGVLTITPIMLILFAKPRDIWSSRRWNVMLPLLICLILVVTAFVFIRHREAQKQRLEFQLETERISQNLQNKLSNHTNAVKNLERLYASSDSVSRDDFTTFVFNTIEGNKEISALLWPPQIVHDQRNSFESQVLSEGFLNFRLNEKNLQNQLVQAAPRENYFPITYLYPFVASSPAFGYDMGSDTVRRTAIEDARDSGNIIVTDPLTLVTASTGNVSVLLYAPVYVHGKPLTDTAQRRDAFLGVTASVLEVGPVIESLLTDQEKKNILLKFYDLSYPSSKGVFFNHIVQPDPQYSIQSTINFGGRQYALITQPSASYWKDHVSWITLITMVGGLLFTGLLGIYLLVSTAHTFNVETLVTRRTRELHDKEERLQAILGNAAEGILTIDENGIIESANQSAEFLLAYLPGTLTAHPIFDIFPDESSETVLCHYLGKAVQQEWPLALEKNSNRHHLIGKKSNGKDIHLELAITRVEFGWQTLLVVILHDLTEERRIEKLKSEFVSAVSHELRTPLTSIRGVLGLLVGGVGGEMPEKSKSLLTMANDNAIRLTTLINDLLDFEKLEYGGMQFSFAHESLNDLLEKSMQANHGYAQNFNVSMQFNADAQADVLVTVDAQRFIQVLSNLLSNAIKFSKERGRIDIRVTKINRLVRVEVQDYGIGISKEFKNSIFQKFTQEDAKAARKYAGTGLGLSLAKIMIEKMHGTIGFSSVEGEGSIFYIELPLDS